RRGAFAYVVPYDLWVKRGYKSSGMIQFAREHDVVPCFHADFASANWVTPELCGPYRQLRSLSRQIVVAIRNCADGEGRLLSGHYADLLPVLGRPVRLRLILRHGRNGKLSILTSVRDRPFCRCLSRRRCHNLLL